MAGLITVEDLRANFPFVIHTDVQDEQLALPLVSASRRLKSWIGEGTYADAIDEDETEERRLILQHAEGYLAMHYAILGLQTNMRNFGLVKSEQVEGDTVNSYFTPAETANFVTQYLEMAREIAEPFMTSDGTPTAVPQTTDDC